LKSILVLLFACLVAVGPAYAEGVLVERAEAELVRVVDGDTLNVSLKGMCPLLGEEIGIRIRGIDTPELRSPDLRVRALAIQAKQYVSEIMDSAKILELRDLERWIYFRLVADIYVDGLNVATALAEQDLALPYDGGKRPDWSRHINLNK
jgi:endonuclease YncB( thermonuclease family)